MKKPFNLYFLFLLIAFYVTGCASTPNNTNVEAENAKKIVIEIYNNHQKSSGTGFVIDVLKDQIYILTASHVVAGDQNPTLTFFEGSKLKAEEIVYADDNEDGLALLSVDGRGISLKIYYYLPKEDELKAGSTVFTIGFPRGGAEWAYEELKYSGSKGADLLFSGNINEGNSGGPVINGKKIVGVITRSGRYVHVVPILSIRAFLNGIKEGYEILAQHEERRPSLETIGIGITMKPPIPSIEQRKEKTTTPSIKNITVLESINNMCQALESYDIDTFSQETKYLKGNSQLYDIANALREAFKERKRYSITKHGFRFLLEAKRLSGEIGKKSSCRKVSLKKILNEFKEWF